MKKNLKRIRRLVAAIALFFFLVGVAGTDAYAIDKKVRLEKGLFLMEGIKNLDIALKYGNVKTIFTTIGLPKLKQDVECYKVNDEVNSGYDLWISANDGEMSVSVENFDTKGADLYNMPDEAIKKFFGDLEGQIRNSMKKTETKSYAPTQRARLQATSSTAIQTKFTAT